MAGSPDYSVRLGARIHSTSPADAESRERVRTHGYGYQWWHNCYRTGSGTFESPTAAGNGQQRIYVLPALRLVVTVLAGRYNDPSAARLTKRFLLEQVVPAVRMVSNTRSMPEPASCHASGQDVGR